MGRKKKNPGQASSSLTPESSNKEDHGGKEQLLEGNDAEMNGTVNPVMVEREVQNPVQVEEESGKNGHMEVSQLK